MFNLIVLIVSILSNLILGLLVYRANSKSSTNKLFTGLVLVTVLWLVGTYLADVPGTYFPNDLYAPVYALIAVRVTMVLATAQIFMIFLFVHTFPRSTIQLNKKFLLASCLYSTLVMVVAASPYMFTGLRDLRPVNPSPGPGILFFLIEVLIFFGGAAILFIEKIRKAKGLLRQQLSYLTFGVLVTFGLVAISNFLLPVVFKIASFISLTPIYILILSGTIAYAIIAHRLFDIRVIIKRTVVYSALLLFILVTYAATIFVFSTVISGTAPQMGVRSLAPNLIAALLIALGFEPLRIWLSEVTDKYLFKGQYKAEEVLRQLSDTLSQVVDLDEALNSMMHLIIQALRIHLSATFILQKIDNKTSVKRVKSLGYKDKDILQLEQDDPLILHFQTNKNLLVTEELERACEGDTTDFGKHCSLIVSKLHHLHAAVALPIFVTEHNGNEHADKLIGIFILGEKLSGDVFTDADIRLLEIVAGQTAAAIEKARFYEEDQLKSEFVSIASHELLTPTAAIEGYLSMILDENMGKVDTKAREYLTRVYSSARRLSELVKDLLTVSRIEAGRVVVDRQPFDLIPIIQDTVDNMLIKVKEQKITLTFQKPSEKLPMVYADAEKTTQVLFNLIGNAVKYNKPGGWVKVKLIKNKQHITVAVEDNGIGISEDAQKHMFEKFFRAEEVQAAYYQGTGLGLYVTKSIVEMMGGKIWFESKLGKGTTFSFSLPISTGHEHHMIIGDPKLMTSEQRQILEEEQGKSQPEKSEVQKSPGESRA